jgi:hypothetical protein
VSTPHNYAAFACAVVLACLAVATPSAQDQRVGLIVGYQRLATDDITLPTGLTLDLGGALSARWMALGGVDWSRGRTEVFGFRRTTTTVAARAGLRYTTRDRAVLRPFAQALVGIERSGHDIDPFGRDTEHHPLVQPGAGVDVRLSRRLSAYAQVDWRLVQRTLLSDHAVRVSAGGQLMLR